MIRLLILCVAMLASNSFAAEIRLASAANFYPTLNKIKLQFEKNTGHKLTIIRGSTGKLYAQIVRGAPYDIFFSADSVRPEKLVSQGKSYKQQSGIYAIGLLALWKPDLDSSQEIREQLMSGKFNKLAIANPRTAPYGKAAVQALKAMELYQQVKNKLVYGENISQTLQFVQSGAADMGLVARAHVKHDMYWEIDSYFHQPIVQKYVILKQSKHPELAMAFIQFMQTPDIQSLIRADGYQL